MPKTSQIYAIFAKCKGPPNKQIKTDTYNIVIIVI